RVENLEVGPEAPRSVLRRCGLLQLVVVLAGGQRNEEATLLHPVPFCFKVGSTFLLSSHRREKEERNRFIAVLFRESCRTGTFSEYDREEIGAPAAYGG